MYRLTHIPLTLISLLLLVSCTAHIIVPQVVNPVCSGEQPADLFPAGVGTQESPYIICTPIQFALIASQSSLLSSYFELGSDLDLSSFDTPIGDYDAIAVSGAGFSGVFDGKGFTLSGFQMSEATTDHPLGLFRYLAGGTIRNLKLKNFTVEGTYEVAALVGRASDGTIENITVESVSVNATQSGRGYAGALIGRLESTLDNSVTEIVVSGSVRGVGSVGGLIGSISVTSGTLTLSTVSTSSLTVLDQEVPAGSPFGFGGVIGELTVAGATAAMNISDLNSVNSSVRGTSTVGGTIGKILVQGAASFTLSRVTSQGVVSHHSGILTSQVIHGGSVGLISLNTTGTSAVLEDIAVQGTVHGSDGFAGLIAQTLLQDASSFALSRANFQGTIDYLPGTYTGNTVGGLIAYLRFTNPNGAASITDSHVVANIVSPGSWTGGLLSTLNYAGSATYGTNLSFQNISAQGTITSTGATGTTTGNKAFGGSSVGGLFGMLGATAGNTVAVSHAYADVATHITSAFTTITAFSGLIGYSVSPGSMTISDCYSKGSIASDNKVTSSGGIFGATSAATVSRCYSDTAFSLAPTSTQTGAFAGNATSMTASASYANTDRAASINGVATVLSGISSVNSAALLTQSTFSGWDFSNTWSILETISSPTLR